MIRMIKFACGAVCCWAAAIAQAAIRLPAGYTEASCIVVTNVNQYVDTGFSPYYMTDIEAHFSVPDFSQDNILYWTRAGDFNSFAFITKANTADPTGTRKLRAYRSSNGNSTIETTLDVYLTSTDIQYSTKYVDNRTDNTFTVNGQTVSFSPATTTGRQPNLYLFRLNNNGALYSDIKATVGMKLYSFKAIENGVAVADFVPCVRDSDGMGGLYDTARDVFYEDAKGWGFGYEAKKRTGLAIFIR